MGSSPRGDIRKREREGERDRGGGEGGGEGKEGRKGLVRRQDKKIRRRARDMDI